VEKRRLGTQALEASALGLGCMGMSEFYGTADEGEAIATIHRPLELSGRIRSVDDLEEGDFRRDNPRFQGDNFHKNLELVERVEELAAANGCTAAQVALAWVLAQGDDIVPIPGTTRVENLEENVAALAVELTDEELRDLEAVFPKGAAAGDRYADMSPINR
jgi:aryl-alcohol dehydrogenase-like predicted oxidoreductase